ncbi:MAG: HlyD family efflux transporter periplasmic adaptor subunit [Tannerella sp.]|nr:HlyD family efflux transporter periplasmic adaptor subunit [Tannerella sp.]
MKKAIILLMITMLTACNGNRADYDATGVFETTEVIVSAEGNGEILCLDIAEGQDVEAQTPVGLIDTTQLYLRKVQLQASIGALNSRQVNVPRQIAALQEQIATAKREQKRFETLVAQNAANRKQLDDINAQLATLEKQLAAQRETITNSNSSMTGEQQSLAAQIAIIDDQIRNSIIVSPIRGTVLGKYAEQGELAAVGRALFKVADISEMYLRAYITASQLTELRVGQQVTVYSDMGAADRREYVGTVSMISDKAEFTPKTIQTRDERANLVYAVKIKVRNDGFIKRGMYGELRIKN